MIDPNLNSEPEGPSFCDLNAPQGQGPQIELPELVQSTQLTQQDKEQLASVYQACFEAAPWRESWPIADALRQIESYLASDIDMIVLRDQGSIVGMVIGMPLTTYEQRNRPDACELQSYADGNNTYYLADFTVDSNMQGIGLGSKLIQAFTQLAQRTGYDSIITRTRIDNLSALRVFTRHGFMSKGVYSATTGGVESDRTVLSRRL